MGALGDLLERLHRSGAGLRTVRATLHERTDLALAHAAFSRHAEAAGAALRGPGLDQPPGRGVRELEIRLWIERPARLREEIRVGDGDLAVAVRDGGRWWRHDPAWGLTEGDGPSDVGAEVEHLFDPARFLADLEFHPIGDAILAGRRAVLAHAVPRPPEPGIERVALARLGAGADEYELGVDVEHGVLLLAVARLEGEEFTRTEVREVVFDDPIPHGVFGLEPPPTPA